MREIVNLAMFDFVVCKCFQFGHIQKFVVWYRAKSYQLTHYLCYPYFLQATHRQFHQTIAGAYMSGLREAEKIYRSLLDT